MTGGGRVEGVGMTDPDDLMLYERDLRQMLVDLRREYDRAAQPIIDQLVRIHSLRPPAPMFVRVDSPEAS